MMVAYKIVTAGLKVLVLILLAVQVYLSLVLRSDGDSVSGGGRRPPPRQQQAFSPSALRRDALDSQRHGKGWPHSYNHTFPRWGDEGIDAVTLLDVMDAVANAPDPHTRVVVDKFSPFAEIPHVLQASGVYASVAIRNRTPKKQIRHRIFPSHRLLHRAWEVLVESERRREGNGQRDRRWSHLREAVFGDDGKAETGVPFLVWHGDFRSCNFRNYRVGSSRGNVTHHSVPIFTTCAHVNCTHAFPLPTYETVGLSPPSAAEWDRKFARAEAHHPWISQKRQLLWRGSLSGPLLNYTSARSRIAAFALKHRGHPLLDVGIHNVPDRHHRRRTTNLTTLLGAAMVSEPRAKDDENDDGNNNDNDNDNDREKDGPEVNPPSAPDLALAPFIPFESFANYRAVLDTDGNSWSSRFGSLLCLNSVVLKVEPHYVDSFYRTLRPWEHYVPIKYDLSDLLEKVEWALDPTNDREVRAVVDRAHAWCRRNMVRDALALEVLDTLDFYVQMLHQHSPDWQYVWRRRRARLFKHLPKLYDMRNLTGERCREARRGACYVP